LTPCAPLKTRETVLADTPTCRATSSRVVFASIARYLQRTVAGAFAACQEMQKNI
jgi:hypothetical protein